MLGSVHKVLMINLVGYTSYETTKSAIG